MVDHAQKVFSESMAADLNISSALAALFDLMHEINSLYDKGKIGKGEAAAVFHLLEKMNSILGVMTLAPVDEIPQDLHDLLKKREESRKKKEYQIADQCRKEIDARGYLIEDTPHGPRLKKKS
jgi:cysteinyl-tRNA synthetase